MKGGIDEDRAVVRGGGVVGRMRVGAVRSVGAGGVCEPSKALPTCGVRTDREVSEAQRIGHLREVELARSSSFIQIAIHDVDLHASRSHRAHLAEHRKQMFRDEVRCLVPTKQGEPPGSAQAVGAGCSRATRPLLNTSMNVSTWVAMTASDTSVSG
jgi:hypothetical protein